MHRFGWSCVLYDQGLPLHGIESNNTNMLRINLFNVIVTDVSEALVRKLVIEIKILERSDLVVPRPVKLRTDTNCQVFAHEIAQNWEDNSESVKGDLLVSQDFHGKS